MRLPDFEKQFILRTDASNTGIGAILLQEESGVKHPVAFASRKLLTRESHYSTIEKECLAIVWAIQKYENFFYGKEFIFGDGSSTLAVLRESPIWTEWSSHALGFGSPTVPIYSQSY